MDNKFKEAYIEGDWDLIESIHSESLSLLKEAVKFMNLVPNNKYGDNYNICSKIDKFLKEYSDE
jgi:hypothetical protein